MKEPKLIGKCVNLMKSSTNVTISVKTRIGIDDMDIGKPLDDFVETTFIFHNVFQFVSNVTVENMPFFLNLQMAHLSTIRCVRSKSLHRNFDSSRKF